MLFKPRCLGNVSLDKEELIKDKKNCRKFGPCGVGEKAIYLNSFYFDRSILYTTFFCKKSVQKSSNE